MNHARFQPIFGARAATVVHPFAMGTQILGTILSIVGFLVLVGTVPHIEEHPGPPIVGTIGFVGGLILYALGRIQWAIRPPTEEEIRRARLTGWVCFGTVILLALLGAFAAFWPSYSPKPPPGPSPELPTRQPFTPPPRGATGRLARARWAAIASRK